MAAEEKNVESKVDKQGGPSAEEASDIAEMSFADLQKLRAQWEAEIREKIKKEDLERQRNPNFVEPGPRYRTTEACYLNDRQYDAGAEFTWHGHPGHFMTPLNEEAKKAMIKHKVMTADGDIIRPGDPVAEGAKITK